MKFKIPDIYNPRYSYGGGKILTELYGINYGRKYFKKLIIFRPHNVYGHDMGNEHVIPELLSKIKNLKKKENKYQGSERNKIIYTRKRFCEAFNLLIMRENILIYIILAQMKELQLLNY